jgi:hypothetical protein
METFVELLMLKKENHLLRSSSFRPSVVRSLTFCILIFFLRTTEHNLTKLGMNDP